MRLVLKLKHFCPKTLGMIQSFGQPEDILSRPIFGSLQATVHLTGYFEAVEPEAIGYRVIPLVRCYALRSHQHSSPSVKFDGPKHVITTSPSPLHGLRHALRKDQTPRHTSVFLRLMIAQNWRPWQPEPAGIHHSVNEKFPRRAHVMTWRDVKSSPWRHGKTRVARS